MQQAHKAMIWRIKNEYIAKDNPAALSTPRGQRPRILGYRFLTPTPEVGVDEESGEITITMPEFPTRAVANNKKLQQPNFLLTFRKFWVILTKRRNEPWTHKTKTTEKTS